MPTKFLLTNDLLLNDSFRKLSNGAKVLFVYCCSLADNEGFFMNKGFAIDVSHTTEHDFDELLTSKLLVTEPRCDGQYAIKLWFLLNNLRFSQMAKSKLVDIRTMIFIKQNGSYTFDDKANAIYYPLFYEVAKRVRLDIGGEHNVITKVFNTVAASQDLSILNNKIITNDNYLVDNCYDVGLILKDVSGEFMRISSKV